MKIIRLLLLCLLLSGFLFIPSVPIVLILMLSAGGLGMAYSARVAHTFNSLSSSDGERLKTIPGRVGNLVLGRCFQKHFRLLFLFWITTAAAAASLALLATPPASLLIANGKVPLTAYLRDEFSESGVLSLLIYSWFRQAIGMSLLAFLLPACVSGAGRSHWLIAAATWALIGFCMWIDRVIDSAINRTTLLEGIRGDADWLGAVMMLESARVAFLAVSGAILYLYARRRW